MIKVKYQVLEPLLDFRKAKDNANLVHPEDNWRSLVPVGADNKRNLCCSGCESEGDVDEVLKKCDVVVEGVYHTKAMSTGYDGTILYVLLHGYLWQIKWNQFHTDCLSCTPYCSACARYSSI